MAKSFLENLSQAAAEKGGYVQYGYGQVEPNHLSAQRTGQIFAQLPTAAGIKVLENGQFVKYDYAARDEEGKGVGEVNFTGEGEWMLVFNEIKLYREEQDDCEFAMVQGNYSALVYSPSDGVELKRLVLVTTVTSQLLLILMLWITPTILTTSTIRTLLL